MSTDTPSLKGSSRMVGPSSRRPGAGPTLGFVMVGRDTRSPEQREADRQAADARAVERSRHLRAVAAEHGGQP